MCLHMSVTAGRAASKKAAKQTRSRHVQRRSAEDVRMTTRQERLWQLFNEIERKLEKLHEENLQLHERIEQLLEKLEYLFTSKQQLLMQPTPQFRGWKKPIGTIFACKLKISSASKGLCAAMWIVSFKVCILVTVMECGQSIVLIMAAPYHMCVHACACFYVYIYMCVCVCVFVCAHLFGNF